MMTYAPSGTSKPTERTGNKRSPILNLCMPPHNRRRMVSIYALNWGKSTRPPRHALASEICNFRALHRCDVVVCGFLPHHHRPAALRCYRSLREGDANAKDLLDYGVGRYRELWDWIWAWHKPRRSRCSQPKTFGLRNTTALGTRTISPMHCERRRAHARRT